MKNRVFLRLGAVVLSTLGVAAMAQPTINVIPGQQMRINPGSSGVFDFGSGDWGILLYMADDNDNGSFGSTFRRWWHVEIADLDGTGGDLTVFLDNAGYSDFIVPVWSLDDGATYSRIPSGESSLSFTVTVPPGPTSVRLAKYYPYTMTHFEDFRSSVNTHEHLTETVIGNSFESRPMYMWEITDGDVSNTSKERVWIHTAIHPSENTAYFQTEGLVDFLLGGSYEANTILENVIFNIVPMANPDGVHHGNYRVSAAHVNLENEWASPYNSTQPEIVAMRTKIEEFMGTSGSPGANPIKMVFNLHASHNLTYPFHFIHTTASTSLLNNQQENAWVTAFRARSPYVNLGSNQSSSLASRVFVESMMFDRYSSQPAWDNVMAITFEGTYQGGPNGSTPNTDDDYRQVGHEMGLAIADYFGIDIVPSNVPDWSLLTE